MNGKPRKDIIFSEYVNIAMDRARRVLRNRFEVEALQKESLSISEWRALLNLARYGDCHLREVSRLATLDASNTSKAAVALEAKNLIRRYDDNGDARRKRLTVTDEGHRVVDRVWARAVDIDGEVCDLIGKTRYKALKEALAMIIEDEQARATSSLAAE